MQTQWRHLLKSYSQRLCRQCKASCRQTAYTHSLQQNHRLPWKPVRQPQQVYQQAASAFQASQRADLPGEESRAAQKEAFQDAAGQNLPIKRKANELTQTINAEQVEADSDEAEKVEGLPADTQEQLIGAMKSRQVRSQSIIHL